MRASGMKTDEGVPARQRSQARAMRAAPTEAEQRLWRLLRDRRLSRLKFRRQVPVGPYIVDFLCVGARLIVEADGSQHGEVCATARATRSARAKAGRCSASGATTSCKARASSSTRSSPAQDCRGEETPHLAPSAPPSPRRKGVAPLPQGEGQRPAGPQGEGSPTRTS